jgi:hypothetical protein
MKMLTKEALLALKNKKVTRIGNPALGYFSVVTDGIGYRRSDQVFPLHPENQFKIGKSLILE